MDSTIFRYSSGHFFDTLTDSNFFRYSSGFYNFSVLTLIQPLSGIRRDKLYILAWILSFPGTPPVLPRIQPFFGTHTNSSLFRYSSGHFFDTRTYSTFSQYSPGFYHFSVLTLIRPFSDTRRDTFSMLARLLHLPSTQPDSTIFRYSHCFYPFPVFALTSCRYSHGFYLLRYLHVFYLFPVLGQILPFFGTHTDSTLFRYASGHFFDTRTSSNFSSYSAGF